MEIGLEKTLQCDRSNENSQHDEACAGLYVDIIQVTCRSFLKSAFTLRNNTNLSVSADWVFPQRNTKNQLQAVSWRPGGLFSRDAHISDKVRILLDIRNESINSLSALMMIFFFFKCQCGEVIRDCLVCRFNTEQVDFLKKKATMDNPEMHHFLKTLKVCKELK